MYISDIERVAVAAAGKAAVCRNHAGKYWVRSIMAGFYIVVAVILSNVTAAVLYPVAPEWGKVLSSLLFSIAIILVVFIGGELFTGNNMTMAIGFYDKKVNAWDVCRVWVNSYIGNFIGAFILSAIFVASGASKGILTDYYSTFIYAKLAISPLQLFLRGIMCNFLVCLAVWTSTRLKSESGKMIIMFCVIMTFVVAGFEHCIANMGIFSVAWMLFDDISILEILKHMLFVTVGNMVGGAVLLALPLKLMSTEQ